MDIKDCIKFANENIVSYVATVEGDQPRVRALGFWFADDKGFYFQTSSVKEIPNQLKNNPKIEICFYKHEGTIGTMLRVSGKVEFVYDAKMKAKALTTAHF